MRVMFVSLLLVLAASCFRPDLGDGVVVCGADNLCPPLYFCHPADQRCYRTPDSDGPMDMVLSAGADLSRGPNDLAGGTDLAGADLAMCTKAVCGQRNCGTIVDGCGGVESCGGACPSNQSCGGGGSGSRKANVCGNGPACVPGQCQQGQDCGLISDGCSAVLDCGACGGGSSCGSDHLCR